MKIAVTYDNGNVFEHFGHSESFAIYEAENGTVIEKRIVGTDGSGHGALAALLKKLDVQVLICGGIGAGAVRALAEAGIRLCAGVTGSCDADVKAYLDGTLDSAAEARCEHPHEGHSCGHHTGSGTPDDGCCGHHADGHSCGGRAEKGNA